VRARYLGWLIPAVLSTGCADPVSLPPKSPPSVTVASIGATATPVQVYGSWHCGNDACTGATGMSSRWPVRGGATSLASLEK